MLTNSFFKAARCIFKLLVLNKKDLSIASLCLMVIYLLETSETLDTGFRRLSTATVKLFNDNLCRNKQLLKSFSVTSEGITLLVSLVLNMPIPISCPSNIYNR